ncbi:transcriptional regulator LldR [Mangrovibacter yixingensis]|uniref:transcriptional regulator LldR n=1 Tax=Mangrovibacter yixingensis TaxID=1529639 RepID=UPI001CFD6C95|nr:transcriptional regulator LldR [Mangrovibacter yixingensis]
MTLVLPRRAEQLVERLRGYIREHKLEAGMRLPAERQLAVELGVSRNSLREALQMLISEGLLLSRRGGGTFIRYQLEPWSEQRIVQPIRHLMADDPDYRYDILEARYAIEASTAWHAAMRATPADKERLQYCFDATLQFKESDDPNLAAQADLRFHLAVAEASHNVVLLQTMRGFFDLLQSSVMQSRQRMYTHPPIFAQLTEQHQMMLDAILQGDAEAARKAATHHLGFVHTTIKRLDEDEARQARVTRLPDSDTDYPRENEA